MYNRKWVERFKLIKEPLQMKMLNRKAKEDPQENDPDFEIASQQ